MAKTFEHILIPYNGTSGSNKAFKKAVFLALSINAEITIITCLESRPTFALFRSKKRNEEMEKEKKIIEKHHLEMKQFAKEKNVPCNSKIVKGKDLVSSEILYYAEKHDIDLIIMSRTKHLSHFEKKHYHSTLENVSRNAQCAILVLN